MKDYESTITYLFDKELEAADTVPKLKELLEYFKQWFEKPTMNITMEEFSMICIRTQRVQIKLFEKVLEKYE